MFPHFHGHKEYIYSRLGEDFNTVLRLQHNCRGHKYHGKHETAVSWWPKQWRTKLGSDRYRHTVFWLVQTGLHLCSVGVWQSSQPFIWVHFTNQWNDTPTSTLELKYIQYIWEAVSENWVRHLPVETPIQMNWKSTFTSINTQSLI